MAEPLKIGGSIWNQIETHISREFGVIGDDVIAALGPEDERTALLVTKLASLLMKFQYLMTIAKIARKQYERKLEKGDNK